MLLRASLNAAAHMAAGLAFGALAAIALSRLGQACSQRVQMSQPMPRTPRLDTEELITMIKYLYDLVMNPERNPLRALPKMVRFQYMVVLAYMWSAVFCIYIGTITLLGPSIAAHTILLIGVFFTADIFRRARNRSLSYDELSKDPADGIAMHDDVRGAPATDMRRANASAG